MLVAGAIDVLHFENVIVSYLEQSNEEYVCILDITRHILGHYIKSDKENNFLKTLLMISKNSDNDFYKQLAKNTIWLYAYVIAKRRDPDRVPGFAEKLKTEFIRTSELLES